MTRLCSRNNSRKHARSRRLARTNLDGCLRVAALRLEISSSVRTRSAALALEVALATRLAPGIGIIAGVKARRNARQTS